MSETTRRIQKQAAGIAGTWLLETLKKEGISLQEACRALDIPIAFFTSKNNLMPLGAYNKLFEWTAKELHDEFLGIHIAEDPSLSQIGLLGYLLQNSASLGDACDMAERYFALVQRGSSLTYRVSGDICQFRYQATPVGRQDIELTLAYLLMFIRHLLDRYYLPTTVYLPHDPPSDLEFHRTFFGESIRYNHAYSGFDFEAILLEVPVNDADTQLLGVLRNQANEMLAQIEKFGDIISHVRLLITASIKRESFGAAETAKELNMDRKTMYRHLANAGVTFKSLKEDVMIQFAKQALVETDASITDIALQLGYSETGAFVRAFKRLTGNTPLKYRKTYRFTAS